VGDRLIVHLTNDLPQPTTIHWHGVRVPIEMDGVPEVSQPAIRRGQSFTYDFILRDAGLFWYHPHVMSAAQVGFGLYGALLVDDPAEDARIGVQDELTLVLSDIGFNDHGTLESADSGGSAGMVFGREGEYVLVNGRRLPSIRARSGALQRWRIVNAAKSRYFKLYFEGQPFTIIGGDGGLQEHSVTTHTPLVAPGERLDVIVTPRGKPGSQMVLLAALYNRGYGSVEFRSPEPLLTVEFSEDLHLPTPPIPSVTRTITPPVASEATLVPMTLTLPRAPAEFCINGVPHWEAKPYLAKLGETQLWIVKNDTKWDHPFHLHGFSFIVLDEKDEPLRPLAWKDTVNIPMEKTARLLVHFDERPGEWMFHCHILDHADGGMMGTVQVGPVASERKHSAHPAHR
jgi:FtsP/CotA-like multicopper oxidase with cupredoxin domain